MRVIQNIDNRLLAIGNPYIKRTAEIRKGDVIIEYAIHFAIRLRLVETDIKLPSLIDAIIRNPPRFWSFIIIVHAQSIERCFRI